MRALTKDFKEHQSTKSAFAAPVWKVHVWIESYWFQQYLLTELEPQKKYLKLFEITMCILITKSIITLAELGLARVTSFYMEIYNKSINFVQDMFFLACF